MVFNPDKVETNDTYFIADVFQLKLTICCPIINIIISNKSDDPLYFVSSTELYHQKAITQ